MLTLDGAMRATEVLLALAFLQQCAEHIFGSRDAAHLFFWRAVLSIGLLLGLYSPWLLLCLSLHSLLVLHRYQGPYNGGSDRMGLLVLYCLTTSSWLPDGILKEAAFGYLAVQLVVSYFMSGQVKIINPDWRNGQALQDVFHFSAYPVSQELRALAHRPRVLFGASWAVIIFELLFPLSFLNNMSLITALILAVLFHAANACLFGLNRFLWFWIAAYPSLIWMHIRLIPFA